MRAGGEGDIVSCVLLRPTQHHERERRWEGDLYRQREERGERGTNFLKKRNAEVTSRLPPMNSSETSQGKRNRRQEQGLERVEQVSSIPTDRLSSLLRRNSANHRRRRSG